MLNAAGGEQQPAVLSCWSAVQDGRLGLSDASRKPYKGLCVPPAGSLCAAGAGIHGAVVQVGCRSSARGAARPPLPFGSTG